MATAAELLAAIEAAILDLATNGEEVWFNGRKYRKAQLSELRAIRTELKAEVALSSAGGIFDRMKTGAPYRA